MSTLLTATRRLLVLRGRPSTASVESLRKALASRGDGAAPTRAVRRVAHVTERSVAGRRVVTLTPRGPASGARLIYTHGGCYTFPIVAPLWGILAGLIARSGVTVDVPFYGLAPQHHATEALEFLEAVFDEAVAAGGAAPRVHLGGDSAGGGLALAQAQRYRARSGVQPASIQLISPWVDVTMTNPGVAAIAPLDHMLGAVGLGEAGRLWAGDLDPRDARVSPLYGDLSGLPPVAVFQGDHDILYPDAEEVTRRILKAGGTAHLHVAHGAFHDYPGAPWLPEARAALDAMAAALSAGPARSSVR